MIDKLNAAGINVLIIRDIPETERGGLVIPDSAKKKPHTGNIISVGTLVRDRTIKKGKKAIFNASVGYELEFNDGTVTVLNEEQITATV